MTAPGDLTSPYARLLAASQEACAAGQYAVAYHALATAMHAAVGLADPARLAEVEALAGGQMVWIDAHAPADPLSMASAARRGTPALWTTPAKQAGVYRRQVEFLHVIGAPAASDRHRPSGRGTP
jgi:hypothetical protein